MKKISKNRRQDLIFQVLKGRDEEAALSAMDIENALKMEGVVVDLRTIRRDLTDLTDTHGLSSTESRPEKFYPAKDYELKYELHLNENTLQVLLIALNNLKFTSHDYFKNFSTEAETAIFSNLEPKVEEELRSSKNRYYFDYSTGGKPSNSNIKDFEKIMQAIRENKIITCTNESPYKDEEYNSRRRKFAPYVFILTSGIPYIIAEDQEDKVLKKLRMTRLKDVRHSTKSFTPNNFEEKLNLGNLIGGWGGISEDSENIEIICDDYMATYFRERVIHPSQKVSPITDKSFKIEITCALSSELSRLISSFGGHVEKVMPQRLNDEVKEIWESGLKKAA
ncbi:MAG: WYL domain-containing protein [Bacteriovoracaceae bacterium]|jgi:predicted DNA-binding transcriptional regulator YafY|nr:WYL domain-containing protein [Bacteriovoracaceae bacterium]